MSLYKQKPSVKTSIQIDLNRMFERVYKYKHLYKCLYTRFKKNLIQKSDLNKKNKIFKKS